MSDTKLMDTLFVAFIKEQIRQHNGPIGKSISKNPDGFTMDKYKSLLLSLSSLRYKEIASILNISYAGLRFWRNDEDYLRGIDSLTREFAMSVVTYLIYLTEDSQVKTTHDGQEVIGFACDTSVFSEFWDIPIYSDDLMNAIYAEAKEAIYAGRLPRELWINFYNHLGYVFAMRKGYIQPLEVTRDDTIVDRMIPPEKSPIVEEYSNGLTLFTFVNIFEKPWKASADEIDDVRSRFIEQIKGVL